MNIHFFPRRVIAVVVLTWGLLAGQPMQADQTKANNNVSLDQGGSWVSGVAPGQNDAAIWDATMTIATNCTNTLGAAATWGSIVINNPAAPVYLSGNPTLTLSNGVSLANATVNLTLDFSALNLAANQTWTVASGRAVTTGATGRPGAVNSPNNGNYTITKTGGGSWTTSGNGDNGSTGITVNQGTVNLNKASSGGTHAVGGPGLTINGGAVVRITGTGGDQIYDGTFVSVASGGTFDLNGNSEAFANLYGAGVVDNLAAGTTATLTLNNANSTFSGTIRNAGVGAKLNLIKSGTGTLTLNGANAYTGGTTVNGGTLALTSTANVAMPYTNNAGGTLMVTATDTSHSVAMTSLTLGSGNPALTFDLGGMRNLTIPLVNVSGSLQINGNVTVNVMNAVQSGTNILLQYSGARTGTGSFVAGTLPAGMALVDDVANSRVISIYVSLNQPRVIIPTLNTNEIVVVVATPQQYGAVGDGITDDSGAFQAAMNAVYNAGGSGGGVVFVPLGNYAFTHNISIPSGVTLHGDWRDWTKNGGGLAGTTFKVYHGAGQTNGTPFITMNHSTALRDVNIWYPNQDPNNITGYPYAINVGNDSVVQNVVLVNAYQGVVGGGDKHILRTLVGTPLYRGIDLDQIFDVCHAEDVHFSPDIWAESGVTNAPALGGAYAVWMRAHGEGMRLRRVDGDMLMDTFIDGYAVGFEANTATNGQPGVTFYGGAISNCAVALLAQDMPSAFGLMLANITLDGDVAVSRTNTVDDANIMFDHCQLIGRSGTAVSMTGNSWHSWMQFEDCVISNALTLAGPGVFNVVNSTLEGTTQASLNANATRAAFTGCAFVSATNIINYGNASNVLIDAQQSLSSALPLVAWSEVASNSESRRPATTNLCVATDVAYGAYGDGVHDDTVAIQRALTAAGNGGGGIVYLPAGKYKLTGSLDVPGGVELRGAFEMRHRTQPGADGHAKGTILQPYGGRGTTNGPPAVLLEANAGLTGVTISYESQNTNCVPFPPAIQGRGANIYLRGICCPNPYDYVDLASYTCTNHLIDMVDGWALDKGYRFGRGSSGTVMDCHCNWTYWIDNGDSASSLPGSVQAPVLSYTSHNLEMYVLGDCEELMVKDFSIIEKTYMHLIDEAGRGPRVTLINNYCDASIQGYNLEAADPQSTLAAVNSPMTTFNFGNYGDQAQATVAVVSSTNYLGTARFTSSVLWGGTYLDFVVNGGDVGMEGVHMDNHSFIGSEVNGGVFHLINNSAYITYGGFSNFPPYTVTFGAGAGWAGKTNEFIGCYAYNGCSSINVATNNPVTVANDYALASYAVLDPAQPILFGLYPDGTSLYQATGTMIFQILSVAGVDASKVRLTINGVAVTNLAVQGLPTSLTVSYPGLVLNEAYTASITATDSMGRVVATAFNFDTFNPTNDTFEAEDFDYGGGLYLNHAPFGAYAGLAAVEGIDIHSVNAGQGNAAYRPNPPGLETENASDRARMNTLPGVQDYDIGFNNGGNWGNYTRAYPAGQYYLYMRGADGAGAAGDSASLWLVTSGQGTTNQTVTKLGTFAVPATGDWQAYTWVPLMTAGGAKARFTGDGTVKTLRVMTDNGNYNANFYQLVPVYTVPTTPWLALTNEAGGLSFSFLTQAGYNYQLVCKTNLTDAAWTTVGPAVRGDGTVKSMGQTNGAATSFYRLMVQ